MNVEPMRLLRCICLLGLMVTSPICTAGDSSRSGTLTLRDGSTSRGELCAHHSPSSLLWQSPDFTRPFEFQLTGVESLYFADSDILPPKRGEFTLELGNGDLLQGELTDWADGLIHLRSTSLGLLRIREQSLRRFVRAESPSDWLYTGPAGLSQMEIRSGTWREDGARLWTDQPGSCLAANLTIPSKALIDLELEWQGQPDFAFSLTFDPDNEEAPRLGCSIETWGTTLALAGEREHFALVEPILKQVPRMSRVRLRIFLDQTTQTIRVFQPGGVQLAEMQLPTTPPLTEPPPQNPPKPPPQAEPLAPPAGFRLENHGPRLRLNSLRIASWDGVPPSIPGTVPGRILSLDGTSYAGLPRGFDKERLALQVLIPNSEQEERIPLETLALAEFAGEREISPGNITVVLRDQSRLTGDLLRVNDEDLELRSPAIPSDIRVPRESIRSILRQTWESSSPTPNDSISRGQLEMVGTRLNGELMPGEASDSAHCLSWRPEYCDQPIPLKRTSSGRIVFRDVAPSVAHIPRDTSPASPSNNTWSLETPHEIHLITGDTSFCKVVDWDEQGILMQTALGARKQIAHDRIQAVVLAPEIPLPVLSPEKQLRLLTLPRNQQIAPPTHLLCAVTGDLLRCRVISLRQDSLSIQVHQQEMEIPASRVSHILWLHPERLSPKVKASPEELTTVASDSPAVLSKSGGRGQIILTDGNRITLQMQRSSEERIQGEHELRGELEVPLSEVAQILLGRDIETASADLNYNQWVLRKAENPLVIEQATGTQVERQASGLAGKPAPDFQLDLLPGGTYRLSESRGKVIVLDFWASWCGPCMLSMPSLQLAMAEFNADRVQLVSVNIEEQPERIQQALQRLKWVQPVVLDRDGAVSRRFQIDALPQLVIIDARGVVVQHVIGGGQRTADVMSTTVRQLLRE